MASKSNPIHNTEDGVLFNDAAPSESTQASSPFSADSPQPARFQEMAMMLVVSVKSLMVYANEAGHQQSTAEQIKLRDKDIEARIRVISEVMSMGAENGERQLGAFALPINISVSIY